eukprot:CAMPEP_0181292308 /NCGR_PEP_ID=MMETSP1101-20121128/2435_1 /TAXON_ID=46948 /ORGANISM="Rhodomonas abbreviata, Strain Caron Lab Isolate" /LENGTH=600 /DNA_ID=CAMNT_0023396765 /DNA_START=65 /DNA_END=1867 /DNA_ORIENTATION=+
MTKLSVIVTVLGVLSAFVVEAVHRRSMEEMIEMRDGVALHTLIHLPIRDEDHEEGKYTTIVDRSPYGYGDMEWMTDIFIPFGFAAVGQDMRGTEKSEGNFSMWQSDQYDSRDLGDWIVKQKWSNGKIMTLGASADGIGSVQTPKTDPDWLRAQYIIWASTRMYDTLFPFGTYKEKTTVDWLTDLSMPNPDVLYDNLDTVAENEAHTDWWAGLELNDADYAKINYPTAFWAGWYDIFQLGTFQAYEGYNTQSNPAVRGNSKITVDAAGHCLEAGAFFTGNAVLGRTAVVLAQMFEVYGIRPVSRSQIKDVTFYVMSSNDTAGLAAGQYWTSLDDFPKAKMTDYYFNGAGSGTTLFTNPPSPEDPHLSTSYKVDPADPVFTMGGNNLPDSIGGSIPCGPLDQAEQDARSDVLTFQTNTLGEDEELVLSGGLFANLFVSSDAIDTDFMVKISDVYPTGEVRILEDNAVRMRWRENTLTPVYMESGTVYNIEMNLWNTTYVVAPGHALRVSVSSSNNPRFSVNYQNGLVLNDPAYPGENVTATNTIYHSAQYPSKVTLPIIENKNAQLPQVHVLKEVMAAYPSITEDLLQKFSVALDKMASRKR